MATVFEEKTFTETRKVAVSKTCDLCGCQSPKPYSDDWVKGYAENTVTISVTVKHSHGSVFPEGSNVEEFKPDICPDCFEMKVLPALRALGITVEYVDRSW